MKSAEKDSLIRELKRQIKTLTKELTTVKLVNRLVMAESEAIKTEIKRLQTLEWLHEKKRE